MEVDVTGVGSDAAALELRFFSALPDQNIVDLGDLVTLFDGGTAWQQTIPPEFSGAFHFGLVGAGVAFSYTQGQALDLLQLEASMGLDKPWVVYKRASGTNFTLSPLT